MNEFTVTFVYDHVPASGAMPQNPYPGEKPKEVHIYDEITGQASPNLTQGPNPSFRDVFPTIYSATTEFKQKLDNELEGL